PPYLQVGGDRRKDTERCTQRLQALLAEPLPVGAGLHRFPGPAVGTVGGPQARLDIPGQHAGQGRLSNGAQADDPPIEITELFDQLRLAGRGARATTTQYDKRPAEPGHGAYSQDACWPTSSSCPGRSWSSSRSH